MIDAGTGKVIAAGTADKDIAVDPSRGAVYVEAVVRGQRYRSRPFQPVADRGVEIAVVAVPARVLVRFNMIAEASGAAVVTWAQFSILNNSWSPYATPVAIPLPRGFTRPILSEDDRARAALTATGLSLLRPLEPGEQRVTVRFDLAAGADGKVPWALDLPLGAFQSSFRIANEPGVAIAGAKLPVSRLAVDGEDYLSIGEIMILPNQSMAMAIELPKLTAGQAAVARACRPLDPERKTLLRGKPAPDFTAPLLGKRQEAEALSRCAARSPS